MSSSPTHSHPQHGPGEATTLYGGSTPTPPRPRRRPTVRDLAAWKDRHKKWAMLTAYDYTTATVLDESGRAHV